MSVAILFNQKSTIEWAEKVQEFLPNTKVEVYPSIENKNDVDFLITWKPHQNYAAEFPNLKVVQSVGAGVDHLLHTGLKDEVVITRIVDEHLKQDMFEHVLSCVMNGMKNSFTYAQDQSNLFWKPKSYQTINDTTITILGFGEIGKFVSERFSKLGFKVKGWAKSLKESNEIEIFFGEDQFISAIQDSHYIINLLPLTPETENILNYNLFQHFNSQPVLINVGRGGHLDEDDLIKALDQSLISSAYLDVFKQEPLPKDHPFWNRKDIFITPHIASITNVNSAITQVITNYVKYKKGEKLLHQVDLKRGY